MSLAKKNYIPWNKGKHSVINQYVKYPKITSEQKDAIKIDTRSGIIIGKEYGVSKTTIYRIKNERL
jgi:DNA invertase Pin-like site-specific DNA recombinase